MSRSNFSIIAHLQFIMRLSMAIKAICYYVININETLPFVLIKCYINNVFCLQGNFKNWHDQRERGK